MIEIADLPAINATLNSLSAGLLADQRMYRDKVGAR